MRHYIVLLNWNGWEHTIECLESLFRMTGPDFRVVVCDNASSDGSIDKIRSWADGSLLAKPSNPLLAHLSTPPIYKPIVSSLYSRKDIETGSISHEAPITLIENGANIGFAAGNNVGLRYALADSECGYLWILNNDTVVESNALSQMVRFMDGHQETGICGSLTRSYYKPDEVQVYGGLTYRYWTGRASNHGQTHIEDDSADISKLNMHYVNGASMFVRREFLERVGLMEESYFLYFEEIDWATRAQGKFKLGYASKSILYHKEGAAIGSNQQRHKRSRLSEEHLFRNKVLFTKRYAPWAIPTVVAISFIAAVERAYRGDLRRAGLIVLWSLQGLFLRREKSDHAANASWHAV